MHRLISDNLAEDDVLAIEPAGHGGSDEELRAVPGHMSAITKTAIRSAQCVRVGSSVGHGEETRLNMLQLEVLVCKLLAVDGFPTGALESLN